MRRASMPSRRTALRRGAPLRRTAWRRSAPKQPTVPAERRAEVRERSGGVCELGVRYKNTCTGRAVHVHHRSPRGMGGSHGAAREVADRLSNCVDACEACHTWVHEHCPRPDSNGWLLERWQDPTAEPLWRRGEFVFLSDDGRVVPYDEAAA